MLAILEHINMVGKLDINFRRILHMQKLNKFKSLTEQDTLKVVGGSFWQKALGYVAEQAFEHIDNISSGFKAGNHRHTR